MCEQVETERKMFLDVFYSWLYTLFLAINLFEQICYFYIIYFLGEEVYLAILRYN